MKKRGQLLERPRRVPNRKEGHAAPFNSVTLPERPVSAGCQHLIGDLSATTRIVAGVMTTPAIQAEGLVKRFGTTTALAGVDLEVPQGTVLGLLGPNGAGKTTAVRILATRLRADAGRGPATTWSPRPTRSASSSGWPASTLRWTRI